MCGMNFTQGPQKVDQKSKIINFPVVSGFSVIHSLTFNAGAFFPNMGRLQSNSVSSCENADVTEKNANKNKNNFFMLNIVCVIVYDFLVLDFLVSFFFWYLLKKFSNTSSVKLNVFFSPMPSFST